MKLLISLFCKTQEIGNNNKIVDRVIQSYLLMTIDTTVPSYWLNWRFLLCAIWILIAIVVSSILIWRYEGKRNRYNDFRPNGNQGEIEGCLYEDQTWGTCLKSVKPIWLLVYRLTAFCVLLALLLADVIVHSAGVFYFYTQWTFTLVTIYFGLGSLISICGCLHDHREVDPQRDDCLGRDSEQGSSFVSPTLRENADMPAFTRSLNHSDEASSSRAPASFWGYTLQIIFQMCAGAVVLTDSVFWLIIYPFQTGNDYRLTFLDVCFHSVNAILLLGEASLNRLQFPFFRMAYFVLWTCVFVICQWIIHACVSMRWPYAFLDLSSSYSPIWYLGVGLLHLPCFTIFSFVFSIKRRYSLT